MFPVLILAIGAVVSYNGCESSHCAAIDDGTYVTVDVQNDCGLTAPGTATGECRWRITFKNGTYQWQYSDISQSGSYSCEANTVSEPASLINRKSGTFSNDGSVLTWDNVVYKREGAQ